ncbi:MAG: hypothetical protein R3B13_11095 [Polyangiaceae bacterium]
MRRVFGVLAVAGFIVSQLPSCGGSGEGSPNGGGDAGPKCTVAAECDTSACSTATCEDGQCVFTAAPDGDAKEQVVGDCRRIVCENGLASSVIDDGDVVDDDEPCTLDSCENGTPIHEPVLAGTKCKIGAGNGTCQSGSCLVLCSPLTASVQCDDQNPCTDDACLPCSKPECKGQGECGHSALSGMPTPGASQTTGDCHEVRCVEGKSEDAVDPFDIPEDGNECTDDVCNKGVPVNEPVAKGTSCEAVRICNGAGKCVDCSTDSECGGTTQNDCWTPACKLGACVQNNVTSGTPLPAGQQTAGDCRVLVCNGSGSSTSQADPTDLPDDNNPCTDDTCVGTSPSHPKLPAGTPCGNGQSCTSSGTCCAPTTCAAAGKTCGSMSDGCGTTLNCGTCASGDTCSGNVCGCQNGFKGGSETDVDCGGLACGKCATGLKCLASSDCVSGNCVDGVCCNQPCTGTCQACISTKTGQTTGTCANVTNNSDPDNECTATASSTCGTTGMCVNGACAFHPSGTVCGAASCSGNVESPADTCNGSGTCVDGGQTTCAGSYVCSGGKCQTCGDGVKNGTETDVDCGGGGTCAKCVNGKKCTSGADCSSNACIDGYCCNTTCTATCMACNVAGKLGTCSPVPANQDPLDECPGQKTCNGAGACAN